MLSVLPDKLKQALLKEMSEPVPVRDYGMAVAVLRAYLGEDFIKTKVLLSNRPDPFMLNEFDEESDRRFIHIHRVCSLADSIFTIRDVPGFDVVVERLITREIRAPFFEASIAAFFAEQGAAVSIKREQLKRGDDFDFSAEFHHTYLNVEVTELTRDKFSAASISNKLHKKRSQLRNTEPAILYCIIPDDWHNQTDVQFALRAKTYPFFGRSARINAVVYEWERLVRIGEGAALIKVTYPLINAKPRHPGNLQFLFGDKVAASPQILRAFRKGKPPQLTDLRSYKNTFSFVRWANTITN